MKIKQVIRDGNPIWKLECPKCGVWGEIDEDQLNGKVSAICDCGYHETHNYIVKAKIIRRLKI